MESNNKKIGILEKIAFFCANVGNIPVMTIIGSFLLIFYTDIVKLNPVSIGVLFLIARIMDAICDPLMGFLVDHLPRLKMGRFRPWLIVGGLICSLNFLVLWLGPSMAVTGKLVIAYISYLLLGPTFALMDISLNSMIPAMTKSDKERNSLSTIKGLGYLVGSAVVSMVVVPFVAMFPTQKQGYEVLIIVVAIFVFLMALIGGVGIHERVEPTKQERYPFKVLFKIVFQSKPLIVMFAGSLFVMVGMMVRQGATMYYFTYNVKNPGLMVTVSFINLIFSVISVTILPLLAVRFEKKTVLIGAFFISAVGAIILLPVSYGNVPLIIITMAIQNLGMGGFMALNYSIQADTVDYVEWKHGYRTEATVVSLNSFIVKMGQALGGAIPAFVLSTTGYAAGAKTQSAATLTGINFTMSVIPGVLTAIGALIYFAYPITHAKYKTIITDLNERRTKTN